MVGRSQRRWGGAAVVIGFLRRIRLSRMLNRLTEAYRVAVAELMEPEAASMEKQTHFVVPVMPVSVGFIG
ncbi:hypothetical protein QJS10_CPB19g01910 [Acorus calamus]|uniref:Uncharacterized protein n=1 Tax=Acorus calamus TaxID=4465 RepID=A0AAV9CIC0_ACOCL|nr:hypothetical protein QJS10_CPB19g01910 [Acorus calamus]